MFAFSKLQMVCFAKPSYRATVHIENVPSGITRSPSTFAPKRSAVDVVPCTADTLWRPAPAPATRRTSAFPVTATWKLPTRLLQSAALATPFRSALANQACMSSSNGGGAF